MYPSTEIQSYYVAASEIRYAHSNFIPSWYCDRGLFVYRYGKIECLCPPSFFGHRKIKADFMRIILLLINHNETIDHIILIQHPSYMGKHRLYLNYPRSLYFHLRKASDNYNVQFQLYTIDNSTVALLPISQ